MGVSTNAILAFGINLGGPEGGFDPNWKSDYNSGRDWEDEYASRVGISEPTHEYVKGDPAYEAYWGAKRAAVKVCPVEIDTHCSYNYPEYAVVIRAASVTAYRGTPKTLTPDQLAIKPEWRDQIRDFCTLMGLKFQEPTWLLYSLWG